MQLGGIEVAVHTIIGTAIEDFAFVIKLAERIPVSRERPFAAIGDARFHHFERAIEPDRNAVIAENFVVHGLHESAAA